MLIPLALTQFIASFARIEHERRDHQHQQRPRHDRPRRADRDHAVPAVHGGADDPWQQAHRHLGPQAMPDPGPHRLRDRSGDRCARAGSGGADRRLLGVRGRRLGADDPSDLHPRDAGVQRPVVARESVRRHQWNGRDRRRGRTADRRPDHHHDQLASVVPAPGGRRRDDHLPQRQDHRPPASGPDTSIRRGRSCPVRRRDVVPRDRHPPSRQQQHPLASSSRSQPPPCSGSSCTSARANERAKNRCCPPACFATARRTSVSSLRTSNGCS